MVTGSPIKTADEQDLLITWSAIVVDDSPASFGDLKLWKTVTKRNLFTGNFGIILRQKVNVYISYECNLSLYRESFLGGNQAHKKVNFGIRL